MLNFFLTESKHSNITLSDLVNVTMAEAEDNSPTSCLKLGNNYPSEQGTTTQFYCSASGKNETSTSCSGSGAGCTAVTKK